MSKNYFPQDTLKILYYSHWNGLSRCQTEQQHKTISFMGTLRGLVSSHMQLQKDSPLSSSFLSSLREKYSSDMLKESHIFTLTQRPVTYCLSFRVLINFISFSFGTMTISRRQPLFQLTDELNVAGLRCRLWSHTHLCFS